MGCVACVPQDSIYLVESCGKFHKEAVPGCNCVGVPLVCAVAGKVNMRVQQLDVAVETKTRDNVFVQMVVAVQFAVMRDKVYEAYYKLDNPVAQINSYVFDVVRSTVPKQFLDEVFESKDEIAKSVSEELQKQMDEYGFQILHALVVDVSPDNRVKGAMNEINANRRLRIAAEEKAAAAYIETVKRAEADMESKYLQGRGVARQRAAIVKGLKTSVQDFQHEIDDIKKSGDSGVDHKQILDLVMVTQYFDMLKDLATGRGTTTVFHPYEEGPLSALGEEIRASVLQGNTLRS
ncbi:unnamed protein product [Vitrella brassicaformis CCMP3155]|uniref:Band 7 domain-containing protein n=1 Tax=Vitrella brassicaformis (strain CCMP3155) TaxID=1169540 RepID=A0A0G4EN73_VITBC|nr:unnamed protein product [Vitrella brassicaformis CCMP3155]|mmetsp:Transcript_15506/g.36942  ORF Transcript_15506/g.36942 Transcript_15506/m.36942 type:complete len:292 (-) Transcript_15506:246-1121(-)|eukprot:CEL98281.1 unnamed protein product [Vitrella brassicaformis CCMP3155]